MLTIIVAAVFYAAVLAILNRGPMDRHVARSTAYWARYKTNGQRHP